MLSISDWISFLTSEKNSNIGNIIGFTAVIIAAVAVIMSVANNNWGSTVGGALICVSLMIIYYKITGRYGRHAKAAGKLLDEIMLKNEDIMSGNERDLSKIEEKWRREVSTKGEQKNK